MHTIRELKEQEKYKNMLKRKNKEKNIYKTQNETLRIKYEGIKKLLDKKDKEIERLNNIINELEKHCETMLSIFEQMTDEQRQEQLDKYKIYDGFLRRLQELKGSDKV